jgi:hypothetical protein
LRIETRLHNCADPGGVKDLLGTGSLMLRWVNGKLEATAWGASGPNGFASLDVSGLTDYAVRAQVDMAGLTSSLEVWPMDGGARLAKTVPLTGVVPVFSSNSLSFGGPGIACSVAFIRVYTTTVPVNSSPPLISIEGGEILGIVDLEFEGNGNDRTAQGRHMTFSGGAPEWQTTPNYTPICYAGETTTFRAGDPMVLDGSKSYTSDDSQVEFLWQAVSKPETAELYWSSHTTARPSVTGTTFGTYVFQLRVRDTFGREATCSVTHGAVAMDANGVVITGDRNKDLLFGPMIAWGRSPWPQLDETHMIQANSEGSKQGKSYVDQWAVADGAGTVTITATNTRLVTGTGTDFQNDFCGRDGDPTKPLVNAFIVFHLPDPNNGELLYVPRQIASCDSPTQLTLSVPDSTWGNQSGLQYNKSFHKYVGIWSSSGYSANFYDSALAFYNLYYRSGLEKYRDYGRWMADKWASYPLFNKGYDVGSMFPRSQSITGLIPRAWDGDAEHRARYMGYLKRAWARNGLSARLTYTTDCCEREQGYRLAFAASCALFSDDPAVREECKTDTYTLLTKPNGFFAKKDAGHGVWIVPPTFGPGTVSVENGSRRVRLTGGTFAGSYTSYDYFWSCANPCNSNADGDPAPVNYQPITVISPTEIDIGRPYQGPTASGRLWQIYIIPGFFTQPYMQGMIGVGINWARQALTDAGKTCVNNGETLPCEAALGNTMNGIVQYLRSRGIDSTNTKGPWYSREGPTCEPNPAGRIPYCDQGAGVQNNQNPNRTQTAEVTRTFAETWLATNDPSIRDFFDQIYGAAWGKYGGPQSDGRYAGDYENLALGRWFGFGYGFGFSTTWPAARLLTEWPRRLEPRTLWQSFTPLDPGATQVRVWVRDPNGNGVSGSPFICEFSSCAITIDDARMGNHLMRLQYLNASGDVLSEGKWQPLAVEP